MMKNISILSLILASFGMLTVACEKAEFEKTGAVISSTATGARSPNLLYEEDMEGSSIFSTAHAIENCGTTWTLSTVTNPAYQGAKAARFEIRKGQPLVSKGIRSEVTIIKGTEYPNFPRDIWYSFAVFFPSVGFEYDDTRDCINQWYEDGSDETTIRAQQDKLFLEVTPPLKSSTLMKYDLFGTTSNANSINGFNNIPKDKWHQFVFHFIHSKNSDGLIEVWRDSVKIHTIPGRNIHLQLPKWKIGIYKSSFQDKSSIHTSRVVYYDNVRVGNSNASFTEMIGDTTNINPPPPPPTNAGVVSYTLVNASTNQDIKTLTDGEIINRNALGVSKFNIRANTATGSGPVVKFIMSGAVAKTVITDVAPYALFGYKNGRYSVWTAPAGNYRLEANAYLGTKNSLGAATGTPYVINFTIQ
ncbi:polysaccharide lyase [Adhaeribacter terreus]|uniref:Polysaccharide lyase n=1 Tax=Adhaeribacter terreus TaxID=529703 RepID=A0ABW0ED89_9BACT